MTARRRPIRRAPSWGPFGLRVAASLAAMATALVGCGSAAPSGPTATSGPTAAPSGAIGEIDHPTGGTTVILRLDEGGGFVPPGFLVTEAPQFSLYGDGTAIFRDPSSSPPPPLGQVIRNAPYQAVRLSEEQVQTLLAFALGPGGLAIARAQYSLPVADAPTTTFSVHAGGLVRTVSVNGLGIGADAGADTPILAALANLRSRLMTFGSSIGGEAPWTPDHYRGVLMDGSNGGTQGGQAIAWPWTAVQPSDFVMPADPNGPRWPTRVMTPAEVAALGLDGLEGGAQGLRVSRPAADPPGLPYDLALRPLLPDEAS